MLEDAHYDSERLRVRASHLGQCGLRVRRSAVQCNMQRLGPSSSGGEDAEARRHPSAPRVGPRTQFIYPNTQHVGMLLLPMRHVSARELHCGQKAPGPARAPDPNRAQPLSPGRGCTPPNRAGPCSPRGIRRFGDAAHRSTLKPSAGFSSGQMAAPQVSLPAGSCPATHVPRDAGTRPLCHPGPLAAPQSHQVRRHRRAGCWTGEWEHAAVTRPGT